MAVSKPPAVRVRTNCCMTAKIIAVETPNISIPSAASNGPNNFQELDMTISP